ncbi:hypothetical protein Q31b_51750 [Novipirellula aureliae]|uniref:DUF2149 domain-containing protein n=1 Tax=Novipirellula aureliae TaxID=2527966 RepID=A0A5C6DG23_9BACT|nr:DUF2149 domain-containing protein [Novipirellula aureliae]TWU35740.1 hypothetical protein Q31b_51750 [Novipirellula aureliae]
MSSAHPLGTHVRNSKVRRPARHIGYEMAAANDAEPIDPLASMANLFDVAMVFAVALMVALVSYLQMPALLSSKDYTVITNPGKSDMQIIVKEGQEIKHYEANNEVGSGQGELLGKAYRLPDGRVVYVPSDSPAELPAE